MLRDQEPWLRRAVGQGRGVDEVVAGTELVTSFVVGFVVEEQERAQSGPARYSLAQRHEAVGEDVPLTRQAGRLLTTDPEARFERHLAVILAGLTAATGAG